jgi:tetratricopeptide (TPR) repeat protein
MDLKEELLLPIVLLLLPAFFLIFPVSAYPNEAVILYDTGHMLILSGNYTDAVRTFDRAIAIEPRFFEAWNGKADALNRAQQYNDALIASDHALALNHDYVAGWINRGYILYNLGLYEDEMKAYETAIGIDPESPEAWFNRGYALAAMGRYDEAIRSFDRVAELNPMYPNLQANRDIAVKDRNASTPFVLRYGPWLALICFTILGSGWWVYRKRKKK